MNNRPIGVFDSGLGGLTVVRALSQLLPGEHIIYFGDTGRVPYGTRGPDIIAEYARQDEAFLLRRDVKLIIAACGTVSSVAPQTGEALPVPFLGVVEPAAAAAAAATKTGRVGVLGTSATIRSGAYTRALSQIDPAICVTSTDCPLFVPLVENGWIDEDDEVTILTVRRYLRAVREAEVDTLILGCTHYPLIAPIIAREMGDGVTLISAGDAAASKAAQLLKDRGMLAEAGRAGRHEYFVTDRPDGFTHTASLFLQQPLSAQVTQIRVEA